MSLTDYRAFGRTGVKISPLILGTMMFGNRTDLATSLRIIARARDVGINVLDTANVYSRGKSEEVVGEALKQAGNRDGVFLATKVHLPMHDTDANLRGSSRRHIVAQAEASLRRLGTDYVDLYQIHRPEPDTAIDETLRAFDDLVRSGKTRYIGCSTFAGWQLVESLWAAKELGLNRFVSEQPPYNLLDRRIERELIPAAQTFGLAVIPWSPLGGGLLTGKYERGKKLPEDSRFANPNRVGARRLVDGVYDVVGALAGLASARNVPVSQLATAWVMQQPGITAPIIGPRTEEQFEDAIAAAHITLTTEELAKIDAIVPPGDFVSPFYEGRFGASVYHW